ncbi:MAG: cupin domain-containing protein [Firmicutes bacterium]|nr:cupin domain-containing protein [Bacillota bacterium]
MALNEEHPIVDHRLIMENDLVRVWDVLLYPGEALKMNQYDLPSLVVVVEGDRTELVRPNGSSEALNEPPGSFRYHEAGEAYALKNVGRTKYWSRILEMKTTPYVHLIDAEETFYDDDYAHVAQTVLFENELIRLWEIALPVGGGHPTHHHLLPYVILSVEGGHNQMKWEDGRTTRSYEGPGFVLFRDPGGIHRLYNMDESKPYLNRLVEIKVPSYPLPDLKAPLASEVLVDTTASEWQPKSLKGLSEIRLWTNEDTGATISLVKFAKGSGIPQPHKHASNQFMFCLSGEYMYTATNTVLKPGSFYWNPQGNVHGPTIANEDSVLVEIYDGPHYPEKPSWYTDDKDAK